MSDKEQQYTKVQKHLRICFKLVLCKCSCVSVDSSWRCVSSQISRPAGDTLSKRKGLTSTQQQHPKPYGDDLPSEALHHLAFMIEGLVWPEFGA